MSLFACRQVVALFFVVAMELDVAEFRWELEKKCESFTHQETVFGGR